MLYVELLRVEPRTPILQIGISRCPVGLYRSGRQVWDGTA